MNSACIARLMLWFSANQESKSIFIPDTDSYKEECWFIEDHEYKKVDGVTRRRLIYLEMFGVSDFPLDEYDEIQTTCQSSACVNPYHYKIVNYVPDRVKINKEEMYKILFWLIRENASYILKHIVVDTLQPDKCWVWYSKGKKHFDIIKDEVCYDVREFLYVVGKGASINDDEVVSITCEESKCVNPEHYILKKKPQK